MSPEITEGLATPPEPNGSPGDTMSACFKYLHVGGTAKGKSFHLSLDLAEPLVFNSLPRAPGVPAGDLHAAWADKDHLDAAWTLGVLHGHFEHGFIVLWNFHLWTMYVRIRNTSPTTTLRRTPELALRGSHLDI